MADRCEECGGTGFIYYLGRHDDIRPCSCRPVPPPEPLVLHCPRCGTQHIDRDEWATRPHRTHLCESCAHEWKPFEHPTVGVEAT